MTEDAMKEYEYLKVEREDKVTIITVNRPEVYNALHSPAHFEFAEVFDNFRDDPDQWIAILTGAGD
ncbi:MAG: enoyl-CoA hydratase-related protein, partial [Alphaproteobacteria bacterium]